MNKRTKLCLLGFLIFDMTGKASAKQMDTVSIGFYGVNFGHLAEISDQNTNKFRDEFLAINNLQNLRTTVSGDGAKDPRGLAISYRHEFNDTWGIITQAAYATDDGTQSYATLRKNEDGTKSNFNGHLDVKGDVAYLGFGPTYRINDLFSIYGLISGYYKQISYDISHIRDNKPSSADDYFIADSGKNNKFDVGYAFGIQANVYKGLVLDASYNPSGTGNWKTNGFVLGLGYNF